MGPKPTIPIEIPAAEAICAQYPALGWLFEILPLADGAAPPASGPNYRTSYTVDEVVEGLKNYPFPKGGYFPKANREIVNGWCRRALALTRRSNNPINVMPGLADLGTFGYRLFRESLVVFFALLIQGQLPQEIFDDGTATASNAG